MQTMKLPAGPMPQTRGSKYELELSDDRSYYRNVIHVSLVPMEKGAKVPDKDRVIAESLVALYGTGQEIHLTVIGMGEDDACHRIETLQGKMSQDYIAFIYQDYLFRTRYTRGWTMMEMLSKVPFETTITVRAKG